MAGETSTPKKMKRAGDSSQEKVLIAELLEIQEENGYLPKEILEDVAKRRSIPLSRLYGVVTFYSQFKLKPVGKNVIRVCHGTACYVSGAQGVTDALSDDLGVAEGGTTDDGEFTLEGVACLGCCGLAPVMMIGESTHGCLTPAEAVKAVKSLPDENVNETDE